MSERYLILNLLFFQWGRRGSKEQIKFIPYHPYFLWGPPGEKRDGVIRHILERESGNWMEKIALFRE